MWKGKEYDHEKNFWVNLIFLARRLPDTRFENDAQCHFTAESEKREGILRTRCLGNIGSILTLLFCVGKQSALLLLLYHLYYIIERGQFIFY